MRQIYLQQSLECGQCVGLDEKNTHHLKNVLRMKNGDIIRVADINRRCFFASLDLETNTALINEEIQGGQNREITYIAALIKKDKWEILLQKAAELGATRIVPLFCKRCIIHLEDKEIDKKVQRWNLITREACQQSNRHDLCIVEKPITIAQINNYKSDINLLAYEKENNVYIANQLDGSSSVSFICGPEGGFEPKEAETLIQKGFISVSLGKRILRAETAGLYALSVIDAKEAENEVCDL